MSEPTEHPLVSAYLKDFDSAAAILSAPRRALLREEVAAHLRDALTPGMSDSAVAAVIARLGSPAEIVAAENNGLVTPSRRGGEKSAVILAVLAAVTGVMAVVVVGPSAIAYIWGPPGLIFSAFVWTLGGVLTVACVALLIAARRTRKVDRA